MPKFSIAFVVPEKESHLKHRVLEADSKDAALKKFFEEELKELYSEDDQGFFYFKEDFFDDTAVAGNIIEL